MEKRVLVGVDGSEGATQALRWAAAEAGRRQAPLHVVHAWVWPLYRVNLGPAQGAPPGAGLQAQAERTLEEAAERAQKVWPGLEVSTELLTGDAAARLVAASHDAQLLVVGHRGLGGFADLMLGSVGVAAAVHAACPVAVVRGETERSGPVVVGVDGPEHSQQTIMEAFAAAHRMGAPLLAVHSFDVPVRRQSALSYREHVLAAEEDAGALVAAELAEARAEYPQVRVEVRLGDNPPAKELVLVSEHARLVVVGPRGSGGFRELFLGSVSHALIHHAHCPVLVIR
jgi:nucleotide-binding universal stress UspA family protein